MLLQCDDNARTRRLLPLLVALLVLSAVVTVAVMPGLNLQPSALRASRASQGMFVGFSLLASVATDIADAALSSIEFLPFAGESCGPLHSHLFDLTCARLC